MTSLLMVAAMYKNMGLKARRAAVPKATQRGRGQISRAAK